MLGKKCMDYLQTLGKISSTTNGLTRLILTQEHKKSIDLISSWMEGLNLDIEIDEIGNVIGTYKSSFPNAPTLVVASHQDSVKCGGIFDGMLGIIVPLVGLEEAKHNNRSYPFNIKLIAFAEEEGTRFETSLMGSKVFAGTFKEELLKSVDENGITLEEAVTKFGFNTKNLTNLHPRKDVDAYLEFHIEQGPVLENESLPAGIVSSITGFKSFKISVNGKSGHAGTLPMNMRLDAGCCACECVLAIEKVAKTTADLVATVGKMNFYPSSSNVVPERAEFTLDVRSCSQEILDNSVEKIFNEISHICENRKLNYTSELAFENVPVPCSNKITKIIEKSFIDLNLNPFYIYSGAGHDAQEMDNITDIGMVFIRCAGGVSHNPDESVSVDDLDTAVKIFLKILDNLDLK
ncbi:TPA: M20 family metallo-hydrolase [Clostridioides difficile]|nr:M20 family metallo-hydrolase [Clostridioides difficile]